MLKKWVRSERLRKFLFVSSQVRWFIEKRLAAIIAQDREAVLESWRRYYAICFTERDSMASKEGLPKMKPTILAENNPAIIVIFPHTYLHWAFALIGWEINSGLSPNCQTTNSRSALPTMASRRPSSEEFWRVRQPLSDFELERAASVTKTVKSAAPENSTIPRTLVPLPTLHAL
jgi:hypothetical protein